MTGITTFEFAHEETRTGIVLQVAGVSGPRTARTVAELAFEFAGEQSAPPVSDPGWWAIMFGMAGQSFGQASVQRVANRAETHVTVQVARARMIEIRPDWPLVRFGPSGRWHDLRGEAALRHGPSDRELLEYGATLPVDAGVAGEALEPVGVLELDRMFDLGVIEWRRGADGMVRLHGAGS